MIPVKSKHPPGGVLIITGELTRYQAAMRSVSRLRVPSGSGNHWLAGALISANVNRGLEEVLRNPDMQWAWIMGDDHAFDPNILIDLLDREVDIVVPLCLNRKPPLDPTIVENDKQRLKYLEDLPGSGLYQLGDDETCGDAGMLIRRGAIEKLGPVWYETMQSGSHRAEDQAFVAKARRAGFDVYVDLDHPIGHFATVMLMPVRNGDAWEVKIDCMGAPMCQLGAVRRPQ